MNDAPHFSLELEQVDTYEFRVRYDVPELPDLLLVEPRALGGVRSVDGAGQEVWVDGTVRRKGGKPQAAA